MASGRKMRSAKNAPRDLPEITSTTRPSTSTERLYSHAAPGWWARGTVASRSTSSALLRSRESTPARA